MSPRQMRNNRILESDTALIMETGRAPRSIMNGKSYQSYISIPASLSVSLSRVLLFMHTTQRVKYKLHRMARLL